MGVLGFSSTFIFATTTFPAYSAAIWSSIGAIILHGPHHSAQKSRRTGMFDLSTSCSKLESETWTICWLTRDNLQWHRDVFQHDGSSEKRVDGAPRSRDDGRCRVGQNVWI